MAGALPIGWLFGQSDYLLFADGIALAMLAAVGLTRGRRVRSTPWLGLALFGTLASLGRAAMLMAQASTRYADLAAIGVLLECLAALLLLPCVYARARLAPGLLWAGTLAPAGVALVVAFSPIRCDVDVLAQACLPWLACNWAAVAMLGTTRRVREPVPWRMRTAALMLVLYGVAVALPALARHTLRAGSGRLAAAPGGTATADGGERLAARIRAGRGRTLSAIFHRLGADGRLVDPGGELRAGQPGRAQRVCGSASGTPAARPGGSGGAVARVDRHAARDAAG